MAKDKKQPVEKKPKVPRKKLSERFNFKAMKRKAIIGGLVTSFATVGVGVPVLTKYSYDQTARTVQFKLERISDKKTVVETLCTQKETTIFKKWDGAGWFDTSDGENAFEDEVKSATYPECTSEVLDRLVETSEGTFKNNPSTLDLKNESDVNIIDNNLKAGNWYEAVVKGYGFQGDGNIISLKRLPDDWNKNVIPKTKVPIEQPKQVSTGGADIDILQRQLDILKLQQQLDEAQKAQSPIVKNVIPAPTRVIAPTK